MTWPAPAAPFAGMEFAEAVAFLRARTPGFAPALASAQAGASANAFWIADITSLSVIDRVYRSINDAVANGTTMEEWAASVRDELRREYPADMSDRQVDARINLIFRNSAQRAYAEGRYQQAQDPAIKRARPYFLFDAVIDERTSDQCRAMDGVIREQDDPLWDTQSPPRHHACRSGLRTLSRRQVEARGGVTGEITAEPASPGFGARPGTAPQYRPPPGRYAPELEAVMQQRATERGLE